MIAKHIHFNGKAMPSTGESPIPFKTEQNKTKQL